MARVTRPEVAAAVDCGSNSTRMQVARRTDNGLEVLTRRQVVTRLGQAVDETGQLDPSAIGRTVDTIEQFADVWREHGATSVRIVATSAVRDAANRDRFVRAVTERVGAEPEILQGSAEAALAFEGAVRAVDPPRPALVLDIGGGSTELIVGTDTPAASTSRQLGCVRLTERALPGDPPALEAVAAALGLIDAELNAAEPIIAPHAPASIVAVAGTATTLAALQLGLERYDAARVHGTAVPIAGVHALVAWLRESAAAEIAARGTVQEGREDVLLAGALILARVLDRFELTEVIVSEGDLLDAVCRQALAAG